MRLACPLLKERCSKGHRPRLFGDWPFTELIREGSHYVVPDYSFGKRTMWRITLPNGQMVVIAQNHVESGGLQAKLTDDAGNSEPVAAEVAD